MLFSKSIPDSVLENSAASKFVSVLDSLQEHKQGIITDAVRSLNPILSTNEKWLRKYLTDYGFSEIPKGFPIRVMQQMLLNADTIMRLRGSKLGMEFFLSVCSLGEATIDADVLHQPLEFIFPDSLNYGYLTDNNVDAPLYLCNTNELMENSILFVTLKSRYFDERYDVEKGAIVRYLQNVIPNYVGFSNNLTILLSFQKRSKFYYHGLLNPQYVNTKELLLDADEFKPIFGGVVQSTFGQTTQVSTKPLTGKPML